MIMEWKDLIYSPEKYCISNFGIIISKRKNILLKPLINRYGYPYVRLFIDNKSKFFYIHRLVAIHFLDNIYNKTQVNHKDYDRGNYQVSNLEWSTPSENQKHMRKRDYEKFPQKHYKKRTKTNFNNEISSQVDINKKLDLLISLVHWHNYANSS